MLNYEQKRVLLEYAREAIRAYFNQRGEFSPDEAEIPYELCENTGVYVDLVNSSGVLRGSAGYTETNRPLWKGVIINAVNAGFYDSKTRNLSQNEFNDVDIQISVLSVPKKLNYTDSEDLKNKIQQGVGLIIKKGMQSATLLPYNWNGGVSKADFLDNLCVRAGLSPDAWETTKLDVYTYDAQTFSERDFRSN